MTTPWRPANGGQGMEFEDRFCYRCEKNGGVNGCEIMMRAMFYAIGNPGYPVEWVSVDGVPTCTSFQEVTK